MHLTSQTWFSQLFHSTTTKPSYEPEVVNILYNWKYILVMEMKTKILIL